METGALLTRLTIWASLIAYTAGEVGRGGLWIAMNEDRSRLVWTLGCLLYMAHVAVAFQYDYGWSHAMAHAETARQTEALFGVGWGVGIFVNYLFTVLWGVEAAWWWVAPATYRTRTGWTERAVRAIFLFMILNGAVVFVDGPMRWLGVSLVMALATTWWTVSRRPSPAGGRRVSDGR